MKAGFIQFAPQFGDADKTIQHLENLFIKATSADIIVLPELANSGYNFDSKAQAFQYSEKIEKSRFVEFLITKAKQLNTNIITGFNERADGEIFNTALLICPEGIKGKYRKMHLFMNEKDFFSKGDLGFPVFDIGICRLGILVCFDYIFSEAWRILGLKGADLVCHPANLVTPYAQKVIPSQSLINRFYIITADRIGTENELTFTGQSIISDPEGDILYQASVNSEEVKILALDVNLARNKMITPRNHVFDDRLPEQYKELGC
ncbi:MAG: carbon-nitrogen hydrolase [Bacteroidetes bacterium]|nr:carbon-nitrogen hydrolase [Bacteroidota bacterium]